MERQRLVTGLTVTFGAMSVVLVLAGLFGNPVGFVLAAVFAGVTALLYYQASGRLARRVYRRVERQAATGGRGGGARRRARRGSETGRGGFGAGPREEWTGPREDWTGPRQEERRRQRARRGRRGSAGNGAAAARADSGLTARQAYDVLDLDPGADQSAIRSAYRERIKEVHPDADGGDEAAFRRVRTAYERLSD